MCPFSHGMYLWPRQCTKEDMAHNAHAEGRDGEEAAAADAEAEAEVEVEAEAEAEAEAATRTEAGAGAGEMHWPEEVLEQRADRVPQLLDGAVPRATDGTLSIAAQRERERETHTERRRGMCLVREDDCERATVRLRGRTAPPCSLRSSRYAGSEPLTQV